MGGSDPQQPTFITPPPPQITQAPAPNVSETSAQLAESQLKYNPRLTAQAAQLQQQYAPQLAQTEFDVASRFTPQYRQLYEQTFPTQTQNLQTLAEQAGQRLASPQSLTPEQQAAQDAIRNRERDRLLEGIRTQANLGGTLFGGRRANREVEAGAELANQYALADIGLQDQRRAQALQELVTSGQVVFPQVQTPGVQSYGQSVTPSADTLLSAYTQGQIVQQPVYQAGTPGTPSYLGSFAQGYGAGSPYGY